MYVTRGLHRNGKVMMPLIPIILRMDPPCCHWLFIGTNGSHFACGLIGTLHVMYEYCTQEGTTPSNIKLLITIDLELPRTSMLTTKHPLGVLIETPTTMNTLGQPRQLDPISVGGIPNSVRIWRHFGPGINLWPLKRPKIGEVSQHSRGDCIAFEYSPLEFAAFRPCFVCERSHTQCLDNPNASNHSC